MMQKLTEMSRFRPIRSRRLEELDGMLHEMEHAPTGARLVWIDREDENKTFGIAFRTTPEDDTGVFHILEHSVLCGSDRYPVKEPFVELLKSSLNTFLNAMTFPDKTVYPVSSRNDRDFLNLTRVYMDAVFHPRIYTKPEIFGQEGWHYAFGEDGEPRYKGVVFNEMKGAYADADELLDISVRRGLFPESSYRFESGGDPEAIPSLTYEGFLEQHRRFYHPSNSFIFLDGSVDIEAVLRILDEEFLAPYGRIDPAPLPAMQAPVDGGERELFYEQAADEPLEGRTRFARAACLGTFRDRKDLVAAQILSEVLCGNNESPLSRALLSRGLCEDVSLSVIDGVLQPWVVLEAENLKDEDLPEVRKVLDETIAVLSEGLDRELILSALANMEFKTREKDFGTMPRGLVFCLTMLDSWLYDGDPAQNLEVGTLFDELRADMENGYFEKLLRSMLIENPHRCSVILRPSHTAGDEARAREATRLAAASAAWSGGERAALRKAEETLDAWQASEDSPEALATIPMLSRSDLSAEPENLPLEELSLHGIPVLRHEVRTGGIVYMNLYFDLKGAGEADLAAVSLLCRLLGKLPAGPWSARELQTRIQRVFGDLGFAVAPFGAKNAPLECRTFLLVTASTLERDLDEALSMLAVILNETRFDEAGAILELVRQNKTGLSQRIISRGTAAAWSRVAASYSADGVVEEVTGGFSFYQYLKTLEQEYEARSGALCAELAGYARRIFRTEGMLLSVTGAMAGAEETAARRLFESLPAVSNPFLSAPVAPWGRRAEGILIPADVSFAVMGGDVTAYGGAYDGSLVTASQIVTLAYLWNVIRVQGGAYGTGLRLRPSGLALCTSFRDPSGGRSLEMYGKAAAFLRDFAAPGTDITKFLIGTMAEVSPLLTPRLRGTASDGCWLRGQGDEDRRAFLQEILDTDAAALRAAADVFEPVFRDGGICVVGPQPQLDKCPMLDSFLSL